MGIIIDFKYEIKTKHTYKWIECCCILEHVQALHDHLLCEFFLQKLKGIIEHCISQLFLSLYLSKYVCIQLRKRQLFLFTCKN